MFDFLPSTRRLLEALEQEWPDPTTAKQADDQEPIRAALAEFENRLSGTLPQETFKEGTWPASPAAVDAFVAALADQRGSPVGDLLAYTLVRCGHSDDAIISALCTWDSQLFRWKKAGLTARDLLARCRSAGIAGNPTDEDIQRMDGWLADPRAALASYSSGNLRGTLLKGRTATGSLYHNGGSPEYAPLFEQLAATAAPPLPISNVVQTPGDEFLTDANYGTIMASIAAALPPELRGRPVFDDPETIWKIDYRFGGRASTLHVTGDYAWVNDLGLAVAMNGILAGLGRSEQVLRFGTGRNDEGSFWGTYFIADAGPAKALCRELGIPLREFPDWYQF